MHDFAQSLAMSHRASDWPGWGPLYRSLFPGFLGMHDHRQDGAHQRAGIDRSVVCENSKQFLIDEKVRGRNKLTGKVYDDIALEYLSDRDARAPGWVCKPLLADFVAYLIAPLGVAYLMPVPQLQAAWLRWGREWVAQYPRIESRNAGWVTVSVGVPPAVLYAAMGQALRQRFAPFECEDAP